MSNFNVRHIEELVAAGLPLPHADQIELHPWSQKPEIVRFLEDNGIAPIAYSSLVPLSTWRAAPGHASGKTDEMRADGESGDSPFKVMAAKHEVSEARVLLRWGCRAGTRCCPRAPTRRGFGRTRTGDPVNNA
nr:aldo/keto reductase [Actinosynnema mirum]